MIIDKPCKHSLANLCNPYYSFNILLEHGFEEEKEAEADRAENSQYCENESSSLSLDIAKKSPRNVHFKFVYFSFNSILLLNSYIYLISSFVPFFNRVGNNIDIYQGRDACSDNVYVLMAYFIFSFR